jgi:hypothetical protein
LDGSLARASSIFFWSKPMITASANQGHRCCHGVEAIQFLKRGGIRGHVTILKLHAFLRKKLFRPLTEHSSGLRENCD